MSSPLVPTNPFLLFNNAASEGWARGVTIGRTAEIFEARYADLTSIARAVGFGDHTVVPIVDAETATHEVSAAVWNNVGIAPAAVSIRADDGVIGAANPQWDGTAGFNSIELTFSQNALATASVGMYVTGDLVRTTA